MQPATKQSTSKFDKQKADDFAHKMLGVVNNAGIAMMTSIGHRTGLFEVMSNLPPSSAPDIARSAGLKERYVKEWLGAMVTGGIVDYQANKQTYYFPPEHAAFLTPAAIPNNLAVSMQFISVLGGVEDQIVECFQKGGGVDYSAYPRFHEVMAEESNQSVCAGLTSAILPLVPGLDEKLSAGINVLDIGCGSGRAVNLMARTYPASRFKGYDFSKEAIANASQEAKKNGVKNARFELKDVAKLDEVEAYDLITAFDAIHDQARPAELLKAIARALKPNGVFLMQDIAGSSSVEKNLNLPLGPFGYTISCMHCMTVSLAQGGDGLGAMWGEEKARAMLKDAGFKNVKVESLPHDILNSYYIATK
jgi:2-polyprenyl-3-methyl-5-hydroxy-6-metoxy-1,4-benzoquinol methylase